MTDGWSMILPILGLIASPILLLLAWSAYLERYEPFPEKVRRYLCVAVLALTFAESYLVWTDSIHPWFAFSIVFVNIWGYLDAVMRFPVVHDIESFFVVKNVILMAGKVGMLAFGFKKLAFINNTCVMLFFMVMNLIGIPSLYLVALPLDEDAVEQRIAAHDVDDCDLASKAFNFVTSGVHRQESYDNLKKRMPKISDEMMSNKVVHSMVENMSPSYRKPISPALRKAI